MYEGRVLVAPEPVVLGRRVVVAHVQPLAHDPLDRRDFDLRYAVLVDHLDVQTAPEARLHAVVDLAVEVGRQSPSPGQPAHQKVLPVLVFVGDCCVCVRVGSSV